MDGLTEGRVVHFVTQAGDHRPAVVVRVWATGRPGYINLQVLTDGSNDGEWGKANIVWETSVDYSEEPKPRTWHWIERP